MPRSSTRRLATSACALAVLAPWLSGLASRASAAPAPAKASGNTSAQSFAPTSEPRRVLDGTRSPQTLLADGKALVVVALFSLPGCPWCEVVRRNYLRHLEAETPAVRVAEYGIVDERRFERIATDHTATNPAALAKSLGIRVAPTVAFFGSDNRELAERLVGYNSADFYGGYLDARVGSALARAEEK